MSVAEGSDRHVDEISQKREVTTRLCLHEPDLEAVVWDGEGVVERSEVSVIKRKGINDFPMERPREEIFRGDILAKTTGSDGDV